MRDETFPLIFSQIFLNFFSSYHYDLKFIRNICRKMDSSMNFQNEDFHQIDEKSDSTMAIDLGPTIGPRLRTNPSDTNSQSSRFVQETYSRKRTASRDSFNDHQNRIEINSFVNKKQRNLLDSHSPQISVPKSHEFSFHQPRLQS